VVLESRSNGGVHTKSHDAWHVEDVDGSGGRYPLVHYSSFDLNRCAALNAFSVSAILNTWSKCLSLAGLYARAEFALKAAASPVLFSKGQLAACSLGADVYDSLISKSLFGFSLPSTPTSRAQGSRPATSRPRTSSRSGTRGGDEDAIRRPVSGGARCDSAGGSAVHFPAQISKDADAADGVQHMMLQEDIEQDADDGIAFHNHQSATVHPELTSWIDVALSAAG